MMKPCPYCRSADAPSEIRTHVVKAGRFKRKSDCRRIQRFRCLDCRKYFSNATGHPAFGQKKRQLNFKINELLCSGISLRRAARYLHVSRTTIDRKFRFLGAQARLELERSNLQRPKVDIVQFDDLITFEHTKCKPLSITMAVEAKTRRVLGFEVSQMPANGHLAAISRKKYGPRKDERAQGRKKLFTTLTKIVEPDAFFHSDESTHYTNDLKRFFPNSTHQRHKGKRGAVTGQGELKKVVYDPLFSLNHTCAMTRANMNRLFRRTWCTTKIRERLTDHFAMYAVYHNKHLKAE